jgi:hypothetical protein
MAIPIAMVWGAARMGVRRRAGVEGRRTARKCGSCGGTDARHGRGVSFGTGSKNTDTYSPPKTTAPIIPATTRNRKRLGMWRSCSLGCMVQTQGDPIMSRRRARASNGSVHLDGASQVLEALGKAVKPQASAVATAAQGNVRQR